MCPRQRRREALRGSLHGAALVPAPAGKSVAVPRREVAAATHPVCLGLEGGPSYSDSDLKRYADPCTVRRWFQRRLESLWLCLAGRWPRPPTLFAWDWKAAHRILIPEANSA